MGILDMDKLFETFTDEAAAKEAEDSKKRTIPTGGYILEGDGYEPREGTGDLPENFPDFLRDRQYAHMSGFVKTKAGDKKGKQFFDVSWQVRRVNPATQKSEPITDENRETATTEKWKQDRPAKLWGMIATAYDATKKPIKEILEMFKMYPLSVFITENFQTPEGWKSPKTEEERGKYQQQGYRAVNSIVSIGKVK